MGRNPHCRLIDPADPVSLARLGGMSQQVQSANPFRQFDALPPEFQAVIIGVLDGMAARPEIQRVRQVATDALALRAGEHVLDAGCGGGEVARALAATVGPTGRVVALDLSAATVDVAASRHDGGPIEYVIGDVSALGLPDAIFDAVRCERVLQHLTDPDAAVAELARVTRPGGRVCLIDTDWDSLTVDGVRADLAAGVFGHFLSDSRAHHSGSGRTLRRRMVRAGLVDATAIPVTFAFAHPDDAAIVIPLFNREVPAETDMFPEELRAAWFADVAETAARDEFLAALTIWVAVASKPSGRSPSELGSRT